MLLSHSHLRLNSLILCIPFWRWGSWDQAKRFSWYQQNLQRSDKELIPKLNEDLKEAEDLIFQDQNTWRTLGEHLEIMGWSRRWFEIIKLLFKESFSREVHKTRSFSSLCVSDSLTYVYTNTYIHACRCCFSSQDYLLANFVEGTSL